MAQAAAALDGGQVEKKIGVLNFHTPGTIETDIIERVNASTRVGVMPLSPNTSMTPSATARVVSAERRPRPRR